MQRVCKAGTEEAISLYPKALNQDDGTGVSEPQIRRAAGSRVDSPGR